MGGQGSRDRLKEDMSEPGLQIVFNEISAREISALPTLQQLELLSKFRVTPHDLENLDEERFGKLEREGRTLFRYRFNDLRIYFSVEDLKVLVHRVLHKNSFQDFLYRGGMKVRDEDEALSDAGGFWELIDEGENARQE
jgi:mRNA-degrading endonuclease RelE of RelBE toxin-antitoxin system